MTRPLPATYADCLRDARAIVARGGIDLERAIEDDLLLLAQIITSRPEVARDLEPIYDRIERELAAVKTNDIRARALRRIEAARGAAPENRSSV